MASVVKKSAGTFLTAVFVLLIAVQTKGSDLNTRAALLSGTFEIKKELYRIHPRLFASENDFTAAKQWYKSSPKELEQYLPNPKKPNWIPPLLLQEKENAQSSFNLPYIAVSWRVTERPEYLAALREWEPVLKKFEPIVLNRKNPTENNRDLSAGALLLSMAMTYDVIKGKMPQDEEALFRSVLASQAKQTYEDLKNLTSYHYEQNHLIIPVCSLGIAALTLSDELPEAAAWGVFAHNLLSRSFAAIANDGWFFEGISYWSFTMQYPTAYAAALRRSTGEDLFIKPPFKNIPEYLEHNFLPNYDFAFDFADWGPRVNSDSTFQRGYDQPWHSVPTKIMMMIPYLANREHPDKRLQDFIRMKMPLNNSHPALDKALFLMGSFSPLKENIRMSDSAVNPPYHWFQDMDVVHWRSNWSDPDAAAIAFKSGPPAGHAIAKLYPLYPEWRAGLGHVHPDAGSFLLFAYGSFLAGDTGYAVKETKWHNTIAVDGAGQGVSGSAWGAFEKIPYETLNRVHMKDVWLGKSVAASTAVFQDQYESKLEMKKAERRMIFIAGKFLVVHDLIESAKEHRYSWFLHTDTLPKALDTDTYIVENKEAVLKIISLNKTGGFLAEPTMINTQVYPGSPRIQQRGYHLELQSPKVSGFHFLTAMDIQKKSDSSLFTASAGAADPETKAVRIDMKDGTVQCVVYIGDQSDLSGSCGFALYEKGKLSVIGLSGTRLKVNSKNLSIAKGGNIVLRISSEGKWKPEDPNPPVWRLE